MIKIVITLQTMIIREGVVKAIARGIELIPAEVDEKTLEHLNRVLDDTNTVFMLVNKSEEEE